MPADVRRSLSASGRAQGAALICALGGFQGSVSALLGLAEGASAAVSDVTADSLSARALPPDDDTGSVASTAPSLSSRVAAVARESVAARVAAPLRWRFAARAVRRAARAEWLADVPATRRAQDEYIRASMGFTPRYLVDVRNPAARATFVYAIDAVLLTDGEEGLSTAVKNLVCYVLARLAENPTLTAHAAFVANRFGASDCQLAACMDVRFLQALDARHRRRKREECPVSSSSAATTTEDSVDSPPRSPPPPVELAMKRSRSRAELTDELGEPTAGGDRADKRNPMFARMLTASGSRPKRSFSFVRKRRDEKRFQFGEEEGVLDPADDAIEEPATMSNVRSGLEGTPFGHGHFKCQTGVPELSMEEDEERVNEDSESSESSEEPQSVAIPGGQAEIGFASTEPSFYDLGDDPEVPEVNGLNAMEDAGEDDYVFDEDDEDDYGTYGHFADAGDDNDDIIEVNNEIEYFDDESDRQESGESIFSDKEVAVLLLTHDVARASRRNSLRAAKCPDAPPGPLLTPARAAQVYDLFEPEAIMEIVSVIAVFHLLQRWTVCYPYRPGSLEAPVRKFVQTPIAHDLSVGSVGQRSASKSSASLRTQQGRSIRLPRHAVVQL